MKGHLYIICILLNLFYGVDYASGVGGINYGEHGDFIIQDQQEQRTVIQDGQVYTYISLYRVRCRVGHVDVLIRMGLNLESKLIVISWDIGFKIMYIRTEY